MSTEPTREASAGGSVIGGARRRGEKDTYAASGGKHSFHGVTYQLKLLMLFVLRAITSRYSDFKLATEMDDAGQLDDVVFLYPKNKDDPRCGSYYRFLQAKHTSGDTKIKKIDAKDLMNESNGDFSLLKYFQSYMKITRNRDLIGEGDDIKDLIVCTNKGFKFGSRIGDFHLTKDVFEEARNDLGEIAEDEILSTTLWKFKDHFEGREEVVSTLKKHFSTFPCKFAGCVLSEMEYVHEKCVDDSKKQIYESYETAFIQEVVDLESKRFRVDFIDSKNLSAFAKHFRDALIIEYFKKNGQAKSKESEALWIMLRDKPLNLSGFCTELENMLMKPEKVAKKLTDLLRKHKEHKYILAIDSKSVIAKSVFSLKCLNVLVNVGKEFKFSENFLKGEVLSSRVAEFREHLSKQLSYWNMGLSELSNFCFEATCVEKFSTKKLSEEFMPGTQIDEFLEKLTFAVDQPNETDLDCILMEEISRTFHRNDVKTVYHAFLVSMLDWMKEKEGRYFTKEEAKEFFDELRRERIGPIVFDLRDPIDTFTGRAGEVGLLQEALRSTKRDGATAVISQSASISGLGGVGKSELARMYAKMHASEYDNIVWVNAETSASMEASFRRLAFDRLGIRNKNPNGNEKSMESVIEEVYQCMRGKENLLIFDNASQFRAAADNVQGVQNYLPSSSIAGKYYIIITSRNREWGAIKVFNLENFSDDEAIEFLRRSIGDLEDFDESKAREMSKMLGNFPLAMQQAASYIKETKKLMNNVGLTYHTTDYMVSFRAEMKELLNYEFPSECTDRYTRTTLTTWKITLDSISRMKYGKLSINILHIMSYLSPDKIESTSLFALLNGVSKFELASALQLLKQYSMISMVTSTAIVHRLVQLVTRIGVREEGKEQETLKNILKSAAGLDIEHSMTVWGFAEKYKDLVREYSYIPCFIMDQLISIFRYKLAVSFGKKCLSTFNAMNGNVVENSLRIDRTLGVALQFLGKFDESLDKLSSIYEKQKNYYGECHYETLISKKQMSLVLNEQGKYEESLQILEDVLKKQKATLEKSHPDIVETKTCIARLFKFLGKHEEALDAYREVEVTAEVVLGKSHFISIVAKQEILKLEVEIGHKGKKSIASLEKQLDVGHREVNRGQLFARTNYAELVREQGRYQEALRIYSEILEDFQNQSLDDNYDFWTLRHNYAIVLAKSGALHDSLSILTEVGKIQESKLGIKYMDTLNTIHSIADVLSELGDSAGALEHFVQVYTIRKEILGDSHPDTLDCLVSVSREKSNLGNHMEAAETLKELNLVLRSRFGGKHKLTVRAAESYATALRGLQKYSEAYNILNDAYELQKSIHGSRNSDSLRMGISVSVLLAEMGEHEKSLEMLQQIQEAIDAATEEDTFLKMQFTASMARMLYGQNKFKEAHARYVEFHEFQKKNYGECHPDTLKTKMEIALVLRDQGNFEDALIILKEVYDHQVSSEGINPKDSWTTMNLTASILHTQGKHSEALKEWEDILSKQMTALGPNDLRTVRTRVQIAMVLSEQRKHKKALKILEGCHSKFVAEIGEDHSETLSTELGIGILLCKQNKHDQAQKYLLEVYRRAKLSLGDRHPITIDTKKMLDHLLRS